MASSSTQSLLSALTGKYPSFRENELPTARDFLSAIYDTPERTALITRMVNPLKDELLSLAASNRALITRDAESRSFI